MIPKRQRLTTKKSPHAANVRRKRPELVPQQFDRALHLHQAGRLEEAAAIYTQILQTHPSHANTLHLLGVIAHQQGEHATAVELICRAIAANSGVAGYHYNLGNAYQALGRLEESVAALNRALQLQSDFPDAHFALGNVLKLQHRFDESLEAYQHALAARPDFAEAAYNIGNALMAMGRLDEAAAAFQSAIEMQPHFCAAHGNLGSVYEKLGAWNDAAACYRRALDLQPDDLKTLNRLGNVYRTVGDYHGAALYYRKALRIAPHMAAMHSNLGAALQHLRKLDDAIASYEKALEISPGLVSALSNLASLHEASNRLAAARETAEQGLAAAPDDPMCNLVMAKLERREKQYAAGIARLTRIVPPGDTGPFAKDINFELGQLYERVKDSDNAFRHFAAANALSERIHAARHADATRYVREIDLLHNFYAEVDPTPWTQAGTLAAEDRPIFLIGFPRSGTTLLDQILDSHPRLQTLEEKPAVAAMKQVVTAFPQRYPYAAASLTSKQIEQLRDAYFGTVDEYLERRPGTILVDKYPLNSINVGLILRVFPGAKFIVAIRHPCDCCLSCFMQEFEANDAMANFTTLEKSAALYNKVMNLWRQYTALFPHEFHIIRYEDVVADFEDQTRRLLDFLQVGWDDAVLNYTDHARNRGKINTPSYHQVTEPIYHRARYRWTRYRNHLAPALELLQPHIEYFGYSTECE